MLLTMEEKNVPYDTKMVDLGNKPEWFLKKNPEDKISMVKFDENWVPDCDVITQSLEDKYHEPPLATPSEKASVFSQANATLFLAKFYGRAGLINLLESGPEHLRPAIFRSLLYEACGRIVNPVDGSLGLLLSRNWAQCQAAVECTRKKTQSARVKRIADESVNYELGESSNDTWQLESYGPVHGVVDGQVDINEVGLELRLWL
ncbi:unnamed protein product [Cochlearia groenlandica]